MTKELIFGIDVGSSSVRGALFDGGGRMLKRTFFKQERRFAAARNGRDEIDPDQAFRQVVSTIDAVTASAANTKGEVVAAASCTFWHSLMGVDTNGKPTTPVLGWADNRSRDGVAKLRKHLSEVIVQQRNGARFHSSFWPAKLLWLRKNEPDIWKRTAKWISFGDYVSLKLFGRLMTSVSIASGTGIFNIRRCMWDTELLEYLKLGPRQLPEIAPTDDFESTLVEKWRKRWPRLASAIWMLPIADGVANSVGSGCVDETRAALMIGTSGAMRVMFKGEPPTKIPSGLWCYRVDRERMIVGGALSDGGGLYDWLKRNLRIEMSDMAIGKEMDRRGADAHGLTFLPFLAGERSTGYDEFATGSIHGLTMAHDAIDILQAGMEAVAFRFADIFGQLTTIFPDLTIVASGGAMTGSPVWQQMIADVLGRDICLNSASEASLRGAVLLALEKTGKIALSDSISEQSYKAIKFRPECRDIYLNARKRHQTVYTTSAISKN